MSAERIAELKALLEVAKSENRKLTSAIAAADRHLVKLRDCLRAASTAEAIANVLVIVGIDALEACKPSHAIWKHIAPTYKVDELAEYALKNLRGER